MNKVILQLIVSCNVISFTDICLSMICVKGVVIK